jgi:hypothetical protein
VKLGDNKIMPSHETTIERREGIRTKLFDALHFASTAGASALSKQVRTEQSPKTQAERATTVSLALEAVAKNDPTLGRRIFDLLASEKNPSFREAAADMAPGLFPDQVTALEDPTVQRLLEDPDSEVRLIMNSAAFLADGPAIPRE